jgi:membrane-associated phospholipid phosphatase
MNAETRPQPGDRGWPLTTTEPLRRWRPLTLSATAVLAMAFATLTAAVAAGSPDLLRIDNATVLAANALAAAHADLGTAATVLSDIGSPVAVDMVVGVLVLTLLWRRRVRAALYVLLVRLVELAIETVVKVVIDRPRPTVPVVITHASESSFPSGHAAGSAALVVSVLVLLLPRVGRTTASALVTLGALTCLAIAASRVLLGVHYPSDAVAGLILGTLCAVAALPLLPAAGESARPATHG